MRVRKLLTIVHLIPISVKCNLTLTKVIDFAIPFPYTRCLLIQQSGYEGGNRYLEKFKKKPIKMYLTAHCYNSQFPKWVGVSQLSALDFTGMN